MRCENARYMHYDVQATFSRGIGIEIVNNLDQTFNIASLPSGFIRATNIAANAWKVARNV